eukprot:TRINITY_DN16861_c0_g3_i2.p1 TRINITY_DN16861_c0_g3~~TRINITY_DN16861_c0_g3_i2.p1  ORF type:complete len:367 (-),score=69.81 TRINITY_DN16861_c0_g3_i2:129-1229(-)
MINPRDSLCVKKYPITWSDLIKEHPLATPWVLFFNERVPPEIKYNSINQHEADHGAKTNHDASEFQLLKIGCIKTVEDYFRASYFLKKPSDLPANIEFRLFRQSVEPLWESCPHGGAWITKLLLNSNIDRYWQRLVFACIGEQFNTRHVVGIVLSERKYSHFIQVWVDDVEEDAVRIVKILEMIFEEDFSRRKLFFKRHHDAMIDKSSTSKMETFLLRKKSQEEAVNEESKEEAKKEIKEDAKEKAKNEKSERDMEVDAGKKELEKCLKIIKEMSERETARGRRLKGEERIGKERRKEKTIQEPRRGVHTGEKETEEPHERAIFTGMRLREAEVKKNKESNKCAFTRKETCSSSTRTCFNNTLLKN